MDAWMLSQERADAEAGRRRPGTAKERTYAAAGDGSHGPEGGAAPSDLYLEATDATGEVALWFDDVWWMEALKRWADQSLVVHVLPSEAALLHPVVLHHVAMLARVAPGWRVVGYGYAGEVGSDAAIEALATSTYHEVRFVDGVRAGGHGPSAPRFALRVEDLFARVRRVQRQVGATRPILVRAKSMPAATGDAEERKDVKPQTVKQACG